MTKTTNIYPPGHYEDFILTNFVVDHIGIDLNKLGHKTSKEAFKVDLDKSSLIDMADLRKKLSTFIAFIQNCYSDIDDRPLWQKINVIDQAINQYVGIGLLNLETDWFKFIIDYLDKDRAEQSGNTILTVFDINFKWAVCFTLVQDESVLKVEKFEK